MRLIDLLENRIIILDGSMGTMIQKYNLTEEDYRGREFKDYHQDLKGNNDLLNITKPELIKEIHWNYLMAGADIIETNTFNSNAISLADYGLEKLSYKLNIAGVNIAKQVKQEFQEKMNSEKDLFIAGSVGPLNKTLSISPDINRPEYRNIKFLEAKNAYYTQIEALITAGVDVILLETIFDTLNAKAAIVAYHEYNNLQTKSNQVPLMISVTITDASGRTLSGQTIEAFYISIKHAQPLAIGINCSLGAKEMTQYLANFHKINKDSYIIVYPNAGLPNAMGLYDETPETMANYIKNWASNGWVNIVGGCCGSTPEHIKALTEIVKNITPRKK